MFDCSTLSTLPPAGCWIEEFHGEQYSTDPTEVDPQHLGPNDAMIFHQLLTTCEGLPVTGSEDVLVGATYYDPITREPRSEEVVVTVDELLAGSDLMLRKGNAIVTYAETLKEIQTLYFSPANNPTIVELIDAAIAEAEAAAEALAGDPDLEEVVGILTLYRGQFD